jgi:hypothetical protein
MRLVRSARRESRPTSCVVILPVVVHHIFGAVRRVELVYARVQEVRAQWAKQPQHSTTKVQHPRTLWQWGQPCCNADLYLSI